MFSGRMSTAAAALALLTASGCEIPGVEEILSGADGEESGERTAPGDGGDRGTGPDTQRNDDGEDPPPGGSAQQEASATLVRDYVTALAAGSDPDRMREGLELAEDGSTAHDYLHHYVTLFQAWEDEGASVQDADLQSVADNHELCRTEDPATRPDCVVYESFTESDGRLVDLRVDGTDPGPRLSAADGVTEDSEGVHATFLSAYRTLDDNTLVVTVDLTTEDDVSLDLDGAAYVHDGPGRGEEPVALSVGRYELDARSSARAAFYFPGAEAGGELHLGGCLAECSAVVDLAVPVPD